jgi:flagellar biosynthesis protein FlhF
VNVKKFRAANTREALRQVRDVLGADAIILSNRPADGMIEIMAVANMEMASLATPVLAAAPVIRQPRNPYAQEPRPAKYDPAPRSAPADPRPVRREEISVLQRIRQEAMLDATQPAAQQAKPQPQSQTAPSPMDSMAQEMMREIRSLRGMLEGQLAGLAWGELQRSNPVKVEILRHMLAAGFSPGLSRQLLEKLPPGGDFKRGITWVKAALTHNLRAVAAGQDIIERGGVYALVGPTGVGKTTTVAKLAARCRLQHGANKLALLTTDSYRIGAHEQLKIYGKILGVPVYAVKDEADLQFTLADLQNKHLVLIDTVGMSQRDRRLTEQVALLAGAGRSVRRLLLVSANAQASTLEDVVRAYRGADLEGCILTKIDEAISMGGALDVIVRHQLTVHYITNGQRVPEDLHLANATYLVDRALRPAETPAPFHLEEGEYPLLMTGAADDGGAESGALRA